MGAKAQINAHPYVDLTDESFYTSAPVILIIVGLIVFVVAFFGCCGAVKENHCMIVTVSFFLIEYVSGGKISYATHLHEHHRNVRYSTLQ